MKQAWASLKALGGCLSPKHPPAGGCLAEWTAKADFYAAADDADAAADAVCTRGVVIGGRFAPPYKYMIKYMQQKKWQKQQKKWQNQS